MNLISCVNDCIYQKDGLCRLERAVSAGEPSKDGCAYYLKKKTNMSNK